MYNVLSVKQPTETNAHGHELGTEFSAEMVGSLGQLESQSLPRCAALPCSIAKEAMERDHTYDQGEHACFLTHIPTVTAASLDWPTVQLCTQLLTLQA